MQTKVQKWGNSLALRIPKAFAVEIDLEPDSSVELTIQHGQLIITPITELVFSLDDLLAGITDDNRHGEFEFGPPVGKEVW